MLVIGFAADRRTKGKAVAPHPPNRQSPSPADQVQTAYIKARDGGQRVAFCKDFIAANSQYGKARSFGQHHERPEYAEVKPGRTKNALCSPGLDDQMRREVYLLVAFILAGCVPDKPKDLAACQTESDRFYSRYLAVDPAAPAARYIIECMAAKGYDFEIEPAACNSRYPLPTQSTCYKSNNWLAGIIDQFRQSQQSD